MGTVALVAAVNGRDGLNHLPVTLDRIWTQKQLTTQRENEKRVGTELARTR